MALKSLFGAVILVGCGLIGGGTLLAADVAEGTPYYEKDGALDITEWFDGNDYNPTDEAWWRWDDETYQATKDTSGDVDSDEADSGDGWYGYSKRDDNDWYYDYYDPSPYVYSSKNNNDLYEYAARYYDYDNDGLYDAYASFADWDGDGVYEDYDYFVFTDSKSSGQSKNAQNQARDSRLKTVSGKVQKTKLVQVRGGKQHVVVAIQPKDASKDELLVADLGQAEYLKDVNPKVGETVTIKGHSAMVGKQSVVLARSIELDGKKTYVERSLRSISGEVLSTHKAKLRGTEHLMAIVETKQNDRTRKVAVDLGQADRLKMKVEKGSQLTFSGFPVKVKDRTLVLAQTVRDGDKQVQIDRRLLPPSKSSSKQGS